MVQLPVGLLKLKPIRHSLAFNLCLCAPQGLIPHASARGPLEKTQVFQMSTFPDKRQGSPIFQLYCRSTILSSCFIQWVVVLSLSLVCLSLARAGWLAQVFFSWRCTTSAAVPFWSFRAIEPANTSRPSCYQPVVLLHWITLRELIWWNT